jgi:hypothetical protein
MPRRPSVDRAATALANELARVAGAADTRQTPDYRSPDEVGGMLRHRLRRDRCPLPQHHTNPPDVVRGKLQAP